MPAPDELQELDRQGISWQAQTTRAWIEKLAAAPDALSLLEGQTTPSCINAEAKRIQLPRWSIVLLDCDPGVRGRRLARRGQAELATPRMDTWAAYLRGQADALGLPVIDTSSLSIPEVALTVSSFADLLR